MKRVDVPPLAELRLGNRRVCWRGDLAVPHESLWSRVRKFGALNGTYGSELMALFKDPAKPRDRSYDGSVPVSDLRAAATLNHEELAALAVGTGRATLGVIEDYIPEAAQSRYWLQVWAESNLRFCPECLAAGIHVTYFQLHFVHNCPAHKRPLSTKCPRCEARIAYEPPKTAKDCAFRCQCGHVFWRWDDRPTPKPMPMRVCQALERAGEWLRGHTPSIERLRYPSSILFSNPSTAEGSMLGFTQLATFLALAEPQRGQLPGTFRLAARKKYRRTLYLVPGTVAPRRGKTKEKEFTAIYKAICRHLYRRRLRRHRSAMRVIIRDSCESFTPPDMALCWRHPFAPAAHAFLLWRSYWEGISCAENIFKKHEAKQRYSYFSTDYTWREFMTNRFAKVFGTCDGIPRSVRAGVEARWFATCCYTSFLTFIAETVSAFKAQRNLPRTVFRRLSIANFESYMTPILLPFPTEDRLVELHWFDASPRAERSCQKVIDRIPTAREVRKYRDAVDGAQRRLVEAVAGSYRRNRA